MMFRSQTVRPASESGVGMTAVGAIFLASVVWLTLCMDRNVNVYDEGAILYDAARVLDGDLPHRDFYVPYGPGQSNVLAALYKIFGASVLIERVWDTVVRGLIVVL